MTNNENCAILYVWHSFAKNQILEDIDYMKKRILCFIALMCVCMGTLCSCIDDDPRREDTDRTLNIANELQKNQPTPTDIDYSL